MNRIARARAAKGGATREAVLTYRMASLLLEYPTPELLAAVPTMRAALAELPPELAGPLGRTVDHLAGTALPELAAQYVETFDLRRRCSPYLTYYAHGDTRRRGVALVEIKQAFRAAGVEPVTDELPDHLSVLLELASGPGEPAREAGIRLLLTHRAGLELLRLALSDSDSPWSGAVVAVCATLPPLDGDDRTAVARLAAEGPPGEDVGLDPTLAPAGMATLDPYTALTPTEGARR